MPPLTRRTLWRFLPLIALGAVIVLVNTVLGQEAGLRLWGVLAIAVGLGSLAVSRLPIYVGKFEVGVLVGWRKLIIVVPTCALGLALLLWPHEVACTIHLRGYLCR